jgi:DNA-binding IclR family transcriptional regulator
VKKLEPKRPTLYFSNPFSKGLRILSLFRPERNSLSLKEIAQTLSIDPSSAFRFCNTLVGLNYLNKDPRTKLLSPGPKAYALGLNLVKSFSLRQVIAPIVDDVYERQGITIDSGILEGDILVQVYYRAAKDALSYPLPIVASAMHCSSIGKSILANLPENECLDILSRLDFVKRTDRSITDKKQFLAELEKVRRQGFAVNNEEYIVGQIVIGAPFFNLETGRPAGAVSFDFSTIQNSLESVEAKYLDILLKLAKDITAVVR